MRDVSTLGVIRRWALRKNTSIREIARRTGLARNTVRKCLQAGDEVLRDAKQTSPSKLNLFAEEL